ncbi:TPA: hypothetical protein N0F65_009120 [Lagenidium giganteum]|uniref:Nephrocystin 3-like N-terminal domain-containing protein n=1 Tax=Lagenidium giganteum TaxID=4803 RepID=A0AAV2YPY2_9STRA|nr:TPA: hypothetical protein N0F65_009120 [Lagenidium giganteum]
MFRFSKKKSSKAKPSRLERAQSDGMRTQQRATESVVEARRTTNKTVQEPPSFRHTSNGTLDPVSGGDDVEDVFYNLNSMNGAAPSRNTSIRASSRSSTRSTTVQQTTSRSTQNLQVLQENEELLSAHGTLADSADMTAMRAEMQQIKEEMQAIRREMMNEMHLTRYDVLKEVTLLKGTIAQLVTLLQEGGVQGLVTTENEPQPELSPEEVSAISRPPVKYSPKPSRATVAREDSLQSILRGSSRMTQLAPVADSALSKPLSQDQINRLFPLVDSAHDIEQCTRNLEPGSRQFVFDRVQQWLEGQLNAGQDMLLALVGEGGSGKSTVAGALCDKFHEVIVAQHFCKFDRKAKSSPRNVLLSLVNQLTTNLPLFKNQLARLNLRYVLEETDVTTLANKILLEPLNSMDEPVTSKVIVIDGLDQCRNQKDQCNDLLDFLSAIVSHCPAWLGFLITSKPSPEFAAKLPITSVIDFSSKNEQYLADTSVMIDDVLAGLFAEADLPEAKRVLREKSKGNLAYLQFTKQALSQPGMDDEEGSMPIDMLYDLPDSLHEIYEEIFEDKFGKGRNRLWKRVQPLLELIASAAAGPYALMTEDHAREHFSFSKEDLRTVRRSFMDIVAVRHGVYRIEGSTLYEWLTDDRRVGQQFYINTTSGVATLRAIARQESDQTSTSSSESSSDGRPPRRR